MQTRGNCHWLVGTQGNRSHVMDLGGPLTDEGPLGSTHLYKQSSFLVTERYAQLNTVLHTY
jgi:hypothetical protein